MIFSRFFIAVIVCLTVLAQGQVKPSKPTKLFNFKCVTEFPTTSFIFTDDVDYFVVRILHHNGTQFAPFMQRLIVPNDMATILGAAEVAKNTGDDIQLRWEKKACKRLNDEVFSCVGGGESLTTFKKQIKPWQISRSIVSNQTANGEFKKYSLSMSYEIQGTSYDYMMDYQLDECEFVP
jgi:hypothetical protein